jgi:uncharacterized protein YprB with RNaseH-like and TPR domain
MDLRQRLKQLGVVRGPAGLQPAVPPAERRRSRALETLVPGGVLATDDGPCYCANDLRGEEHVHGGLPLGDFLQQAVRAELFAELGRDNGLARADLAQAVFLDTETTGLSGGTGTLVFLVGLGSFEPQPGGGRAFHMRQFFLRDPAEEPAMLAAIAAQVRGRPVVSFNGRAFDLPLLETRYVMARRPSPLTGAPHLDLLHPARRLWRGRIGSCALGSLEEHILGVTRTQDNVPGWLIPQLYAHYLRTGDARRMPGVFYHNLVDVLSMVALAARLARAFGEPEAAGLPARDRLSLARWHDDRGRPQDALEAYRAAYAARDADAAVRAESLEALGRLLRRLGRREEALAVWTELAGLDNGDIRAHVELAKHYEWQHRDALRAAEWTRSALARLERWPAGPARRQTERELRHRLERLERKGGRAPARRDHR